MAALKTQQAGTVAPAFRSGGVPPVDCGPRIPVTAATLMETCWRCVWVAFPSADGWHWSLKCVHGTCPEHRELLRSFVPPRLDAPGSVLTPATGARETAPASED